MNARQELQQARSGDVDPEIHRVRDDEAWKPHLIENVMLQVGRNVSETHDRSFFVCFGQYRREMLKDIQGDRTRLADVQVPHVFPRPAAGFPGNDLEPGEVNVAWFEKLEVLLGKILTNDSHQIHRAVEACRHASIRRGTSQQVSMFLKRGLNVIEGN